LIIDGFGFENHARFHAILQRTETGEYYLIDMGSRNGSFVNGARVSVPVVLKDGDRISLGEYQLAFGCPPVAISGIVESAGPGGVATKGFFAPRRTTVLVVDVRNFTRLAQQIEQSLLCQMIGTWFREGGQIMQLQRSWAQKYIGDALMAVWVHRESAQEEQEVLGIIRALCKFAKITATLQSRFGLPCEIRVGAGMNTGLASIGNTGTGELNDYTALGETVNAAFRFESATKDIGMDVALGEGTFQCLQRCSNPDKYFVTRTVQLKGYERPSAVWATSFSGLESFISEYRGSRPQGASPVRRP
jgi:adenylate cyclase